MKQSNLLFGTILDVEEEICAGCNWCCSGHNFFIVEFKPGIAFEILHFCGEVTSLKKMSDIIDNSHERVCRSGVEDGGDAERGRQDCFKVETSGTVYLGLYPVSI